MVSLSQQGAEGMKQFLELSSSGAISSTQSQPHPGATLLGEHPLPPWGAQTSTDPIPLQSPYPAVYVHVPALPVSLPACCPPLAQEPALHPLVSLGTSMAQYH